MSAPAPWVKQKQEKAAQEKAKAQIFEDPEVKAKAEETKRKYDELESKTVVIKGALQDANGLISQLKSADRNLSFLATDGVIEELKKEVQMINQLNEAMAALLAAATGKEPPKSSTSTTTTTEAPKTTEPAPSPASPTSPSESTASTAPAAEEAAF
eukprot:TRINITY_DN873_c0_g2_i1.p1 TRINITY_DN873_c0_g2~~TRINITY_DN873_c0_g2_i1.p1  ORF type:complete len:156 (+),score=32.67 TRINITY_DN873_c0_g2_i1:75-542(+)